MFQVDIEVEENMMASGKVNQKVEIRKAREENVPSASASSSSNDVKFEMMLKIMEKLMDMITVDNRPLNKEKNEPQIRKPKFRMPYPPPPPQIRQRDMRNPRNQDDQKIRPPFPKNYVAYEEDAKSVVDHIHHFGDLDS